MAADWAIREGKVIVTLSVPGRKPLVLTKEQAESLRIDINRILNSCPKR